ncbi:MAG TPA: phosphoribosylanthranilate isomerase [Bacillota bacterium]|nr:phosphoribosylanthranilate isomerase [Bacillota bacterium]
MSLIRTPKIKLCGMRTPYDIELANRYLPDYCGFVFVPKSRRYVPHDEAAALKKSLDPRVLAVGVFAGEIVDTVARLLERGVIDIAQLHGGEDEEYIARLRELTGKTIIKAFFVRSESDIELAEKSSADYVLLDGSRGGEGRAFDWQLARGLRRDFFLAGGLTPENVCDAIKLSRPYAVDVSSGIERGGAKDARLVEEFLSAVRGFPYELPKG